MIDPAKIKSVLSKASDEQLMQMLKKPDQIPSMFVQQEIARRNKARQASKAQLAALSDATKSRLPVTMTPEQPVTPRGQPIYPETRGGITYMKPGSRVEQKRVNWDKEVPAILAFARESGNAIGRLDNNQEANLVSSVKGIRLVIKAECACAHCAHINRADLNRMVARTTTIRIVQVSDTPE